MAKTVKTVQSPLRAATPTPKAVGQPTANVVKKGGLIMPRRIGKVV